jgi:broad specificity phosphatase PhoE
MNRDMRFYGRLDTPLNPMGIKQAQALQRRFASLQLDACYVSPARRAQQTAALIFDHGRIPKQTSALLWEQDFGDWEGRKITEIAKENPERWETWLRGDLPAPHGGETLAEVAARADEWLRSELPKIPDGGTAVVISHAGFLQTLLCVLLKTPLRERWPYQFGQCAVAEVRIFLDGAALTALHPSPEIT